MTPDGTAPPIRVLVVDDHAVVSEGLVLVLAGFDNIEVVGTASGATAAIDAFGELLPDVVLMDLSMPDIDGVEATRRILAVEPQARVLALTGFVEDDLVRGVLEVGACGYLLKSVGGEELADAIRTAAAGRAVLDPAALRIVSGGPGAPAVGDDLTLRELAVLERIVEGKANKEIAADLGVAVGTIRIHVSNVLAKLQVTNRTAAAFVARNHGLVVGRGRDSGVRIR